MKKSELTEMFNKWLATIPDDETESVESTEEVEKVENSVETESAGGTENTESVESTEKVLSTETVERVETVTENGKYKSEEKRIYVTDSGEYDYR